MGITWKQSNSLLSGKLSFISMPEEGQTSLFQFWSTCPHPPPPPKGRGGTFMDMCITNSLSRVKLWTNISIEMFCDIYGKTCGKNTKEMPQWKSVSPPKQWYHSFCFICAGIYGQKMAQLLLHILHTPLQLLSISSTLDCTGRKIWWLYHIIPGHTCHIQDVRHLQMFFNKGMNAGLTVLSHKGNTSKGTAWNSI
jgi:hypothetical protein